MPKSKKGSRKPKMVANEFYAVKIRKRVKVSPDEISYVKKKNPRNHLTVYMAKAKVKKGGETLKLCKFVKKETYDKKH